MPTVLEVEQFGRWIEYARIEPGKAGGSMSDRSSGRREVLFFRCEPDDSRTVIGQSEGGADWEMGDKRVAVTTGLKPLKEVYPGESHELVVLTDRTSVPRRIRIRHERRSDAP